RQSVGKPDEGATGSVHFVVDRPAGARRIRAPTPRRRDRRTLRTTPAGQETRGRKLRSNRSGWCLTGCRAVHRVPDAPSTECPRLMALRVVVASAVVSRKVGRGRHRLGAFFVRG